MSAPFDSLVSACYVIWKQRSRAMKLVMQYCEDWTYTKLIDKETGKVIVVFNYDDSPTDAMRHVVDALKFVGVKVEEEDVEK